MNPNACEQLRGDGAMPGDGIPWRTNLPGGGHG